MKYFLAFLFVGSAFYGLSQAYEPDPCIGSGNEMIKGLVNGQTLDKIYLDGCGPGWSDGVASSYLKASGTPPAKPAGPQETDGVNEIWEDYSLAYDQWTCSYAPVNLTDGSKSTAWVEGEKEYGIGEVVLVSGIDLNRPLRIWNGYGKSEKLFQYNSRVKLARIHIIEGKIEGATQCGSLFNDLNAVTSIEIDLEDKNGYQKLTIPTFQRRSYQIDGQEWEYRYWLALEILDVYPGTKWKDTCISEISNDTP